MSQRWQDSVTGLSRTRDQHVLLGRVSLGKGPQTSAQLGALG